MKVYPKTTNYMPRQQFRDLATMPREIVTLQFGHYANHVASHIWNAQELSFTYDEAAPVCACSMTMSLVHLTLSVAGT